MNSFENQCHKLPELDGGVQNCDREMIQMTDANTNQIVVTEAELKTYFNLPVLAVIPDADQSVFFDSGKRSYIRAGDLFGGI